MELSEALDYVRERRQGVLTTLKRDGRPQLSNIAYYVGEDATVRISVTADRAKTRNLERDPRASLYVTSDDFWSYCVLECVAALSPTAADAHDATADALVEYYRTLQGEHPDWEEYRRAMVADRRLVVRLPLGRIYGMG